LTYVEHIRLLSCEFEIRTNSQDVVDRLPYITQHAQQDVPVVQRCRVTITWTGDEFSIIGDGMEEDFELSVTSALESLYQGLHRRAIAALPDHIRINAACGTYAGRSFLIVGPKRTGKTALAIYLMLEGFDVTGDELVLMRDGEAVAFPRKFLLRENSLALIPMLGTIDRLKPLIDNPREKRLVALDPLEFGRPWRIAPAAVSAILYIEPNHGARSRLMPCGKLEMTRRVLPQCAAPVSGRRGWLGDLCATVDRADTFVIELGDLKSAVAEIIRVLGQVG